MEDPLEGRGGQRDWGGNTGALGGYGSAGLFSRRRQMERTTGGSFLNLAEAPRGGATGGYVRMPGAGPEPVTRQVEYGRSMGPSGPGATAQFTKPNYYGPGPQEWAPTGRLARSLTAATRVIPWMKGDKEEPQAAQAAPAEPEGPMGQLELFPEDTADTISVGGYTPKGDPNQLSLFDQPEQAPVTQKPPSRASRRSEQPVSGTIARGIKAAEASGFDPIASANKAQEELARRQGLSNSDFNPLYEKLYGKRPYDWGLDKEDLNRD